MGSFQNEGPNLVPLNIRWQYLPQRKGARNFGNSPYRDDLGLWRV